MSDAQKRAAQNIYDNFNKQYEKYRSLNSVVTYGNAFLGGIGVGMTAYGNIAGGPSTEAGMFYAGGTLNGGIIAGHIEEEARQSLIKSYTESYEKIAKLLRYAAYKNNNPNCMGEEENDGKNNKAGIDPSGIVYEGVIENPIEGAKVTLYYAADEYGQPVLERNSGNKEQVLEADGVDGLMPESSVQTTGKDGRFSWATPQGLWLVKAEYASVKGDSMRDRANTVSKYMYTDGENYNFLPVLPIQLDVNIPVIDRSAPKVTNVKYGKDGIYVTFSKYMVSEGSSSVLEDINYVLKNEKGRVTNFVVKGIEQGHAPSNIDSEETVYTRTVLIKPDENTVFGGDYTLTVKGNVESYAYSQMEADYISNGTIKTGGRQTDEIIYGDADNDGEITELDAATVLSKALDSTFVMPIENKTDRWLIYTDVDDDGKITADDAAMIMRKVSYDIFEFPAQR